MNKESIIACKRKYFYLNIDSNILSKLESAMLDVPLYRHGMHQLAQKSGKTYLPLNSDREIGLLLMSSLLKEIASDPGLPAATRFIS